jgi:hypothetical protein
MLNSGPKGSWCHQLPFGPELSMLTHFQMPFLG